jgi:predicted component of type VI protein secretion system
MFEYGIGGNEVRTDASESMADIAQNRTMFLQQLTAEAPVKPQAVYDLKTVDDVFNHFQPNVEVEFETEDGSNKNESLKFGNLGDFSPKNITKQSNFLQDLSIQQEQYQKIGKQLKTNKLLNGVLTNPDAKLAFVTALQALIQELDTHK